MRHPFTRFILIAALLGFGGVWKVVAETPPAANGNPPNTLTAPQGGAKIQFAEMEHDFGRIEGGASVKFDFVFTNVGSAPLEISDVRPACGCTATGAWSKKVEPGQSGTIPIQFNSGNFSGPIHKTVTVTSNTAAQPQTILNLKGTVFKSVDVTPPAVYFTPQADVQTVETKVVRIVNNEDVPLELAPPECANKAFTAELTTLKAGKEFEVRISAKPPFGPGGIQAPITIKTSSKTLPVITINGIVMVQMPITTMPPQLVLGAAPLAVATKLGVTIRNSGNTAVIFSEPTVNVPGVEATVQELQAGRVFNVVLNFPAGFDLKPTGHAELIVKTSHPQYPVVRVPIRQASQTVQPQRPMIPPRIAVTGAVAIPIPQPASQNPPLPLTAKPSVP